MIDRHDVPNDLYDTAVAIARKICRQYGLRQDNHRIEDISQTLFLAGWEVWRDTGEIGLAINRMKSRRVNMINDLRRDLARPRSVSQITVGDQKAGIPVRTGRMSPLSGESPLSEQFVGEFLNGLPERRRTVARLRMAAMTNEEIAKELEISERTVDREIEALKKELEPWRTTQ